MEGLNLHMLNATLGTDVEFRTFDNSDGVVASFSVATNRTYKNKNGEKQTETQWHKIECWNKLAEFAKNHLKKGDNVHVQGEVRTNKSEKDGNTRYFTSTLAKMITFLPKSGGNPSASDAKEQVSNLKNENSTATATATATNNSSNNASEKTATVDQDAFKGNDDDLPF